MLIDWFTVGAQALNFVILVWLMKHFLYQPVLDAIAAREKRIADQLAAAAAKETQEAADRKEFADKNREFDQQRARLLAAATTAATEENKRLLDEAAKAAQTLAAKHQEALKSQAAQLGQAIGNRARDEVFLIARKTLADLAGASLEEQITEVFVSRLRKLADPDKTLLCKALTLTEPALVRSTFESPKAQRATILAAVNETFSAEVALRYETAPDVISGIELRAGGQQLAWSIAEYLASLEGAVAAVMVPSVVSAPASVPAADADSPGSGT